MRIRQQMGACLLASLMMGASAAGNANAGGSATPAVPGKTQPIPTAVEKSSAVDTDERALPPGMITYGLYFGDQETESFGDILIPLASFKSGLLFINPRGTWNDDDGQEFNFGLGYRHLFPERKVILGANIFYDLRNTALDNTFNQFGAGLEFLSEYVDARANVYLPETGRKTADSYAVAEGTASEQGSYWYEPTGQGNQITQYGYDITSVYHVRTLGHYQMFEQAMEGFDAEIGALLPLPVIRHYADVKAFVGLYDYNAHYGDDLTGMKGRLEIRPLPALALDVAWYEDRALIGSRYSAGVRASLPFDLTQLSHGRNPFKGALAGFTPGSQRPAFASRMTEMVIRDLHVRSDVSDPVEVVGDRRQLEKTLIQSDRKDHNLVLASDITFVDDDNRSGVENGTWENPYRQINTGVQKAIGTMVYVRDAAQQYYENVVMREGLTLWGSGAPIYGQGSRYLGGVYPVVNGQGLAPALTLASHVTIAGLEFVQPVPVPHSLAPQSYPLVVQPGIAGQNVTDVTLLHNSLRGGGISLRSIGVASLTATLSDNVVRDVAMGGVAPWQNAPAPGSPNESDSTSGISIYASGVPDVDLTLANNTVLNCRGSGASIYADAPGGTFITRVSGNYSGNLRNGVTLSERGFDTALALFVDTVATGNRGDGISATMANNTMAGILFASHTDVDRLTQLVRSVAGGLTFLPEAAAFSTADVADLMGLRSLYIAGSGMQANGNGGNGVRVSQASEINLAGTLGLQANGNGMNGVTMEQSSGLSTAAVSVAAVVRSEANNNAASGFDLGSQANDLALQVLMDVHANGNGACGIHTVAASPEGWAGTAVLSSDPVLSLVEAVSASPLLSEWVAPMDMGAIPAFGFVQANGNGADGISITAAGTNGAFGVVLDTQANDNGGNGIRMDLESDGGMALGLVASSTVTLELANPLLRSLNLGMALSDTGEPTPVQANGNGGKGITIMANSRDTALAGLVGVEALGNGADGLALGVHSALDNAWAALYAVTADANAGNGISAKVGTDDIHSGAALFGLRVTADNNGKNGMESLVGGDMAQSSTLFLYGVQANSNQLGSGIAATVGATGHVTCVMSGIQADGNGANGMTIVSQNGCRDTMILLYGSDDQEDPWRIPVNAFLPNNSPISLLLGLGGNSSGLHGIETTGNGASGISILADGYGSGLVVITGAEAADNAGVGILAQLQSSNAVGVLLSGVTLDNNHGGLHVEATSQTGDVTLIANRVTASSNSDNGISAILAGPGYAYVAVTQCTANANGGSGIRIDATSLGTNVDMDVGMNVTDSNRTNGLWIGVNAAEDSHLNMVGNQGSGNMLDGLAIDATAGHGLALLGESNVARNNGHDGFYIETTAAAGDENRVYDFGGGALGSQGLNVMAGNGSYGLEHSGEGAFLARSNYWDGVLTPTNGVQYNGSALDVDGALATDPSAP